MRITVIGVLTMIGAMVLLAVILDRISQEIDTGKKSSDEQPLNPS
jgi:ABC-type proline/glycine betaine transport system permease subunit